MAIIKMLKACHAYLNHTSDTQLNVASKFTESKNSVCHADMVGVSVVRRMQSDIRNMSIC